MPSNFLIVGTAGANVDFGTDNVGYSGIGVIVGADREDTGDKLELKDRGGNVFAVVYFNDRNECSIDVIFKTTTTLPERGDALSLCGLTGVLCDSIARKWANEKECMLTIKATKYAELTVA